ncbi:exo-alpha-sialidase [bacterium]|nr:exo-alpha-sialidase [bacterium]
MATLNDGRILLAWSDFYGGYLDYSAARVSALISADGGRTWGRKFVLQENTSALSTFSPSLLRLRSGALAHFYLRQESANETRQCLRKSSDDGQTWGPEICITPDPVRQFVTNDRALQLRDGRLVLPVSWSPDDSHPVFRSLCWYSDDEGVSWTRGRTELYLPGMGAMEPLLVERQDGSLLMIIRTQLGDQYRAGSFDGGDTFTVPRPMGLIGSDAPANCKRIPATGDLLIVWNRIYDPYRMFFGRTPLTAAISRDDGETWAGFRTLEDDPACYFAYPSILFRKQEVLLTYYRSAAEATAVSRQGVFDLARVTSGYYQERGEELPAFLSAGRELKLKILPLKWFYGG